MDSGIGMKGGLDCSICKVHLSSVHSISSYYYVFLQKNYPETILFPEDVNKMV